MSNVTQLIQKEIETETQQRSEHLTICLPTGLPPAQPSLLTSH
jgi:hypothetical protein